MSMKSDEAAYKIRKSLPKYFQNNVLNRKIIYYASFK